MVVRKRTPGFGVESIEHARRRERREGEKGLQERRERTKDINWSSQAEMDEVVERKRKAEDEEPYNTPAVWSKQARLIAQEAARRSMGRSISREAENEDDLGFALPSSPSLDIDTSAVPAREQAEAAPAVTGKDVKPKPWAEKTKRARQHCRYVRNRQAKRAQKKSEAGAEAGAS